MDMKRYIEMIIEIAQEKTIIMSQEEKDYFKSATESLHN